MKPRKTNYVRTKNVTLKYNKGPESQLTKYQ